MSGNIGEWTLSKWGKDYRLPTHLYPYNTDDGRESDESLDRRIIRGGSWRDLSFMVRCSGRASADPLQRSPLIGFRVVQTVY
jgi:formylglycine-generating enzyme required for sulfatase activity